MRSYQRTSIALTLALLLGGCGLFSDGDDVADFSDESETGSDDDGDQPPTRGFRVFPKFMLQDVAGVVTIDLGGPTPLACELDDVEGGYVCDADSLASHSIATITVDKDGFASAVRHPQVPFNQIVPLEVHLAVEGGPTGVWSECQAIGEFGTCEQLCGALQSSCAAASCATADPEWPVASYETFADPECTTPIDSVVASCESELPLTGSSVALRCCCAG